MGKRDHECALVIWGQKRLYVKEGCVQAGRGQERARMTSEDPGIH